MTGTPPPSPADGLRFAFGTLTLLPVSVPRWDRATARLGMVCAPLVGLVVGLNAGALGGLLLVLGGGPLLAAVGTVATGAVLSRGLHLDGLADTADGLGSGGTGRTRQDALRVMRQSDIGPFGVLTLLLVLLAQVAALAELYQRHGWAAGATAAAVSALVARTALTLACREGVPAARPEGLGAAVAAVVPRRTAAAVAVAAVVLAAGAAGALGDRSYGADALAHLAAALAALGAAEVLLRRCRRRFGGVTGDVLGALAETAGTTALVILTLSGPG